MAARCASCSYPLSVSDSVSCVECSSYFHIDCAQLVGFPYYELSVDPIRNTFHCQTCKILPLPQQSAYLSDSDSDDECTMPSRQLDYHLEGPPDLAKDMNEIKGNVQDLSELCKDMFREINELKSINLTLRCCVENLRHEGEQRDGMISELRKRIEALEGKKFVNAFSPIKTNNIYVESNPEKEEDTDRYLTPDPEYSRTKEMENVEEECLQREIQNTLSHEITKSVQPYFKSEISEKYREKSPESWVTEKIAADILATENTENDNTQFVDESISQMKNEDKVHFAEEERISTSDETSAEKETVGSVRDWDWRGNQAVPLNEDKTEDFYEKAGSEKENEEMEEMEEEDENKENEASDVEDTEAQGWEILDEDVKFEKEVLKEQTNFENPQEVLERKGVTWADDVEKHTEDEDSDNEATEPIPNIDPESDEENKYEEEEDSTKPNEVSIRIPSMEAEYMTECFQAIIESRQTDEGEESEDTKDDATDAADRTSLRSIERVETPKTIEGDVDINEEGAEVEDYIKAVYTGRADSAQGSRVGVDSPAATPEGDAREVREGGQSPEESGEVQPSDISGSSEPPPPPQPQHSPDDLWDYLKESVTGERPATVEEFVQKLIGTLEHVPEEYLQPVIEYNIRRANSPSVTDGEYLHEKDTAHHSEGEDHGVEQIQSEEAHSRENGEVDFERGDNTIEPTEGESQFAEDDGYAPEETSAPHEDASQIPDDPSEEPSESTEGYSALEAAT